MPSPSTTSIGRFGQRLGPAWVRQAIVALSATCATLAGLVFVALATRPADDGPVASQSDRSVPIASMASEVDAGVASADGMSAEMSGPSDDAVDPAVARRILRELDSLDWAHPDWPTSPVVAPVAETGAKPLVGRDWLPRPDRAAGTRRETSAVAAAIDSQIEARLQAVGISSAPQADDAEFLRRAFLDLHGHIPPIERTVQFLADTSPDKRAKLIDELLAHPDFGFRLAHYWRDLLLKRDPDKKGLPNETVFVSWLARQFNHGQPWHKTVHAMLTAQGDEALAGQTFFILANEDDKQPAPNKIVATASALFMGIQLQCAECHVHPSVEQWKPDDFWGLAAFFSGTRANRQDAGKGNKGVAGTAELKQVVGGKGGATGQISIPDPKNDGRTIGVAKARLFEADAGAIEARAAHRQTLADWLASADDPYFAPAAVNRLWSILFARGLVEPLDDLRPDNPPTHPELLALLTSEFVAADFDVKHMVRAICNSRAYQRSSRTVSAHEDNEKLYAQATVKVLSPEMLFDSLTIATGGRITRDGTSSAEASATKGSPFAQMSTVEFFDNREYDESAAEYTYGIPQLLRLMNRQLMTACEEVGQREAAGGVRPKTLERMYLTVYSRKPTDVETQRIEKFVREARGTPPAKSYAAALWALLNSAEFFCNR